MGFGDAVLHKTRRTRRKPLTKNNHYHSAHSGRHESHQNAVDPLPTASCNLLREVSISFFLSSEIQQRSSNLLDTTEKKLSSSTIEQMGRKKPSCPAMVLKPADDVRTVSNKATAMTDEQAAALPFFFTMTLRQHLDKEDLKLRFQVLYPRSSTFHPYFSSMTRRKGAARTVPSFRAPLVMSV
ncbi:hypothetical protein DVH24_004477 [Malus domestica]|uniref:Uncharacterized protein n=1 Tax=Malus domestica TaxID=3750 RepID=A0A498IH50_MALDO|nr:hypothetical protein DVH24_004477 [Malus domestica]